MAATAIGWTLYHVKTGSHSNWLGPGPPTTWNGRRFARALDPATGSRNTRNPPSHWKNYEKLFHTGILSNRATDLEPVESVLFGAGVLLCLKINE